MKARIGIDTGGTFTDAFVSFEDGRTASAKARTTPTKLSVGVIDALTSIAKAIGVSLEELLTNTQAISYGTTIATNALIQRIGPKLALITTEGFEDLIFIGKGASWVDGKNVRERRNVGRAKKPIPLISRDMVAGVKERIDWAADIVRPLDDEDVVHKVHYLVDKGAEGIVVCLLWAFINPIHEQRIREIIIRECSESMPVVLSSDVNRKRGDYSRTMTTILNAYVLPILKEELGTLATEFERRHYSGPLMVVHNSGGCADTIHTLPIQTYEGGPVAGVIGAAYLSKQMDYDNVVVTDMGGTSFDVGTIISGGTPFYVWNPVVCEWEVNITMLEVTSIGAGGGSIAWLNPVLANRLESGPQSAGSVPGPAAYDAGGTEPTVTDADVVLGYIDPNYFHGGRVKLNKEKALLAIREKIAKPLGVDVDQAAMLIKKVVDGNMANHIARETLLKGYNPKDFVLFAYGGAGPTHCCGYGFAAGMERLTVFPYSPVFSAAGACVMDVVHIYEQSKRVRLLKPGPGDYLANHEEFNEVVRGLQARAIKDITEEGFLTSNVIFRLELDMRYGGQLHVYRATSPKLIIQSVADIKDMCDEFGRQYANAFSPVVVFPQGGIDVYNFVLHAAVPRPKMELTVYAERDKKPRPSALKSKRDAFWEELGGWHKTPVFDMELLETGNLIEGPALIEAESTTMVLPPRVELSVDRYRNLAIKLIS